MMDMNPFPDCAGGPDERIPVTVMLTPTQAERLEALTANLRALDPSIDDNDVADAVFDTGLAANDTERLPGEIDEAVKRISAAEIQRHAADGELAVVRERVEALQRELDNKTALAEKLEHLLQSARNEAEHLRSHTGAAAALGYVVLRTGSEGEIVHLDPRDWVAALPSAAALEDAKRAAAAELAAGTCSEAKICALVPVMAVVRRVVFEPA